MSIASSTSPDLDVLVIGAGQAALALGYHLKKTNLRFLLVDRNNRVGDSWRQRFDSLVLFTPRAYSALPGLPVHGDPDGYPGKDEIADYLEAYVQRFNLPVQLGVGIERLELDGDKYRAIASTGTTLTAHSVVLATGAFQIPAVPSISRNFADGVLQLTPGTYRNPAYLPSGTVLVVGDGATGRQIARELAATHQVLLAVGRPRKVSRPRVLGKSIFWWMDRLGVMRKSRHSKVGRILMQRDPFPGEGIDLPQLQAHGVRVVPRLAQATGAVATFANGESATIDTIIWTTGYRDDTDWVAIRGATDSRAGFAHDRGVSAVPGLFFIGRSWQWTRGSALLTGVGEDAAYIVQQIIRNGGHAPAPNYSSVSEATASASAS